MANVYLIGEPQLNLEELNRFLEGRDWEADTASDAEILCEVMGRVCYDSFDAHNNQNITHTRKGNKGYLANVIAQGHESVLEHASVSFVFTGVSRVFTHELVRHRVGCAVSQQSLRYVRLNPSTIQLVSETDSGIDIHGAFTKIMEEYSELINSIDWSGLSHAEKKKASSLLRRILPQGMATTIGWSANFRTLRHVINLRTSPAAEAEIREVFSHVKHIVTAKYPNIFGEG